MDHQKRQVHRSGPVSGLRSKRLMGYFCHPTRRHSHLGLSNWTIVVSTRRVRGTDRAGTDRNQYIRGLSTVTSYFVLPLPISSVFLRTHCTPWVMSSFWLIALMAQISLLGGLSNNTFLWKWDCTRMGLKMGEKCIQCPKWNFDKPSESLQFYWLKNAWCHWLLKSKIWRNEGWFRTFAQYCIA